ncbi:SLOG family protein [Clostridium tagluense]|uniref:YspA cpYpsA-related SLOG domain-containing protein n=1 Tax=Clostridium tagluense TaxID=360422 RepID=A0A401UQA7_9CLOT|nr:SLOG family protein [Clostridium tagluense]GCD11725.1 hypothetical protein Ctaglu_33480 [Clostridium tagluense]
MINVFIFGGRDFNNYELLKSKCDLILKDITDDITVISGRAKGADSLGERYAVEKGYKTEYFPAQWDDLEATPCKIKYNKYDKPYNALAGFNRNRDMVDTSDIAIGFWDGLSHGTKDSIELCKKKGIRLEVVNY